MTDPRVDWIRMVITNYFGSDQGEYVRVFRPTTVDHRNASYVDIENGTVYKPGESIPINRALRVHYQ